MLWDVVGEITPIGAFLGVATSQSSNNPSTLRQLAHSSVTYLLPQTGRHIGGIYIYIYGFCLT